MVFVREAKAAEPEENKEPNVSATKKIPTAEQARKKLLALAWSSTHKDYRGVHDGEKTVLKLIEGKGSCLVSLGSMSDAELLAHLPTSSRLEYEAYLFGLPKPSYPVKFDSGKKATWKASGLSGESREVPCNGEAHKTAHNDSCEVCAPRWGVVEIPAEFKSINEMRDWASADAGSLSNCWRKCGARQKPQIHVNETGKFYVICECKNQTAHHDTAAVACEAWENLRSRYYRQAGR